MTTRSFDVINAREHFSALGSTDQIYFDNAGGSQILSSVIDSISSYLSKNNVQLGASYTIGQKSTEAYTAGYEAAARYINASPSEIVIGPSTTQLFRNLSYSLNLSRDDEIVVSCIDHEANIAPWIDLERRFGITVKLWRPKSGTNPKLLASDLESLMTEKTKLVTCTHTSNILGTITDIKSIAKTVHSISGAKLCVDAVAYAPHRRIDVKELDVDFYCFSWYKVYGPHISMLYASTEAQEDMTSLGHFFNASVTLENKLGLAGSSYELTQSIPKVLEYLGQEPTASWSAIAEHEEQLAEVLLSYLRSRNDITIYGEHSSDSKIRVPTISFRVHGRNAKDVVELVESKSSFGFRWGKFYSNRLADEILQVSEDSIVRVSMVHYNTLDEIKSFVKIFDEVVPSSKS